MQQKADGYLMDKKFAASYLGVSLANIDRLTTKGTIGRSGERVFLRRVKIGGLVRFRPEDLSEFADACTEQPTGTAA